MTVVNKAATNPLLTDRRKDKNTISNIRSKEKPSIMLAIMLYPIPAIKVTLRRLFPHDSPNENSSFLQSTMMRVSRTAIIMHKYKICQYNSASESFAP